MLSLNEEDLGVFQRLKDDYPHYAEKCLRIRPKDPRSGNQPFVLNKAQRYLHERLEEQRQHTGKVRALVLKGRQQGISTYVGGRFYHRVTHSRGLRCFILTHEQEATNNLFGMVDRYHENCPELVKPSTGAANAKELYFDLLDSGYAVGTAGTKAVGRSQTVQLFHGCLSPDTPIVDGLTGKLRPMGDFALGDLVRTHTGAVAAVSFVSHQYKEAFSVRLKGLGDFPLVATGEHRFWTPQGWAELSALRVGDRIGFPVAVIAQRRVEWPFRLPNSVRPQGGGSAEVGPESVRADYAWGRVLGLYLAEGCVKKSTAKEPSGITFTVHEREVVRTVDWLTEIGQCFRSVKVAPRKDSKTVTVTAYGRSFATFVRHSCGELDSKRLPQGWADTNSEFVRGLVHGYLAGDGYSSKTPNDRRISATSVRSAITIGMRDALASLGYGWACINHKPAALRHGRNEREAWTLRLCGDGVDRLAKELGWEMPPRKRTGGYGSVLIADGYAWVPVVAIESAGEVPVMDFEINHADHSYCTLHGATHNSEVAFWPNAATHFSGVIQAIPDLPGTEIILESTANGVGGEFHSRWQQAERGEGDYIAIFIPWFWQPEYRRQVPDGFVLTEEEREYQAAYGLDLEQIAWRRNKIDDDLKDAVLFKQEYPANSAEAFQLSGHDSFIKPDLVLKARKATKQALGPLIIGADPARFGNDRFSLAWRRGRKVLKKQSRMKIDVVAGANWIKNVIDEDKPTRVFIDVGGVGGGVYDILKSWGEPYSKIVVPIDFSGSPQNPDITLPSGEKRPGPYNRRAEMWMRSRSWLEEPGGADIPDEDSLQADACGPGYHYNSNSYLLLESKEHMRDRGLSSPDEWDAIALTFAEPVAETASFSREIKYPEFGLA